MNIIKKDPRFQAMMKEQQMKMDRVKSGETTSMGSTRMNLIVRVININIYSVMYSLVDLEDCRPLPTIGGDPIGGHERVLATPICQSEEFCVHVYLSPFASHEHSEVCPFIGLFY